MKSQNKRPQSNVPVAVIGMGCFFPKSSGLKPYWRLISQGRDAVTEVPDSHWSAEDYFTSDPMKSDHVYCKRGGFLSPVSFDPSEFAIPPAALEATDTSQLISLMVAQMALKDAGYGDGRPFDRDKTSVVLGVTGTQELVIPLGARLGHPKWRRALKNAGVDPDTTEEVVERIAESYVPWQENSFPGLLGNVVAGRICNRLDLGGTNCVVDAACASSMSAVNLALLELESGRSDMVIAGGVDAINDIFMHMCFSRTQILSPTGDARPFSKDADGTVLGEGIGMLILKRLEDAEKDADRIYAVIKAIGASSDGKSQSIYAPRVEGQAKALERAYQRALDPSSVELVEAHGTGTRVGDAVEFKALDRVLGKPRRNGERCALGSVKSMIGHTKAAAGAAGLIKTVLALHNKVLPPTLKAEEPDPNLEIAKSPFYLNAATRPWLPRHGEPRRAGVSAFGFGGSNFHIVLEEYQPEKTTISWDGSVEIAAFSAPDLDALVLDVTRFRDQLTGLNDPAEMAFLMAGSRRTFSAEDPFRLLLTVDIPWDRPAVTAALFDEALNSLESRRAGHSWQRKNIFFGGPEKPGKIAFAFPGQGSQYLNMGRDLICTFPAALEAVRAADAQFKSTGELGEIIYPLPPGSAEEKQRQEERLQHTENAQPGIGAVSMAMIDVLREFGITPDATCGHSYGELPALYAAERLDRKTLARLSVLRGSLMANAGKNGNLETGSMVAVNGPLDHIERLVYGIDDVVLANRNTPDQGVISGSTAAVEKAACLCEEQGFRTVKLPVSAAFHSKLIEDAREPFTDTLHQIEINDASIPVYANATAAPYPADAGGTRHLLAEQMVSSVEFVDEIQNMFDDGMTTFVEVGPKSVLTGLIRSILKDRDVHALSLDRSAGRSSGIKDLAAVLCHLASLGHPVQLDRWEDPAEAPVKQRMSIPISGANYRNRQDGSLDTKKPSPKSEPRAYNRATAKVPLPSPRKPITAANPPAGMGQKNHPTPTATKRTATYMNRNAQPNPSMTSAMDVIQEGLTSMQELQVQTAEAHKRFLEGQTEISRTLRHMMEMAGQITGAFETDAAPSRPAEVPYETPAAGSQMPRLDMLREEMLPPDISRKPEGTVAGSPPPAADDPPADGPAPQESLDTVASALLEVVGTLTGYPLEMLSMEMEIEADLGIDSIKRVEILSTLEEKMPHLPPVSPEVMGDLKTLGQIAAYLDAGAGQPQAAPAQTIPPKAPPEGYPGIDVVQSTLLEVVSALTGYPAEMLAPEMEIEADLGIDSIKRVEILSTLEEKMPHLPSVSPEVMGDLKTLGQIAAYLDAGAGQPQAPPAPTDQEKTSPEGYPGIDVVQSTLLEVVSTLTGYPAEMLAPEMEIEADLGIDSIKRVEILSTLEEKMPHLPSVSPEVMGDLKTLGQIAAYLAEPAEAHRPASADKGAGVTPLDSPKRAQTGNLRTFAPAPPKNAIDRKIVSAVPQSLKVAETAPLTLSGKVLVTDDRNGLSKAVVRALASREIRAELLSAEIIGQLADGSAKLDGAAGLVIVQNPVTDNPAADLKTAFLLAKHTGPSLLTSAAGVGGALFATITRLDGAFGFSGRAMKHPATGGLAALAKTASMEWEGVTCRALDIVPEWKDARRIAESIVLELLNNNKPGPLEVGLGPDSRVVLELVPEPPPQGRIDLDRNDVLVISGGARGITAAIAHRLAQHARPTLILLGRSPEPLPEPEWVASLSDEPAIKQAILKHEFGGKPVQPMEIERSFRKLRSNREILETLDRLKKAGAEARYFPVDVRDENSVRKAIDKVRQTHGPVTGLIHAAGTIEDRLIIEKTPEQFDNVLDTKLKGLNNLMAATRRDPLRHLVIFSSVSARFGNVGQADYAMANEALNKIAQQESMDRPHCRVMAINWGPWDGGMVSPALRREFQRRNVPLIPLEGGAACMLQEMAGGRANPVELVIGGKLLPEGGAQIETIEPAEKAPDLHLTVKREIDVDRYPILRSHVLDGNPVVPMALMAEWLGHGALHGNPGLFLQGLDDLRVLTGIKLDTEKRTVRLMAGNPVIKNSVFEVDVELRDGIDAGGAERIHSRARAILADKLPDPPPFADFGAIAAKPYRKSMDEVYEHILFHGAELRGIDKILGYSDRGIVARITAAPPPDRWIVDPLRSRWITDPLVLDSAFQMAIVWCFEEKGLMSLPSFSASYRQYADRFPVDGITAVLEVTQVSDRKMKGDFTFIGRDSRVIASISGYEAIMNHSLARAFKRRHAA